MIKLLSLLLALFMLASCAPKLVAAGPGDTFKLEGKALELDMSSGIVHAEGSVFGTRVTSRFCETGMTPEPIPCEPRPSGYTALDVPEGVWSPQLVVGRVEKPPGAASFFDVQLEGVRVSFRAELTR